jgi:Uncharacterized conserved protein
LELIPSKYFVTCGTAVSDVSDLNAFDKALIEAGIGEQNLLCVSSVIPDGAKLIEPRELPMGAVTHCVLAQMRGSEGEMISAGIAYALRKDGRGGYVAEGHLYGSERSLRDVLKWKMEEMGRIRNVELNEIQFASTEMSIPKDHYGACIAALVFTDYKL